MATLIKLKPSTQHSMNGAFYAHETAIVDEGALIEKNVKIWHFCHVMPDTVVGEGSSLGQNVLVASGVRIGKNVKVQNNVSLYTGVICEDDVFLGPSMVFTNVINPRSAVNRKSEYKPTIVQKGATIGANATILCGITIGRFAFIGAGAVVTKDVKPYALVIGNPARQTGWMSEAGHKLIFDAENQAVCPESGQIYRLEDSKIIKIINAS